KLECRMSKFAFIFFFFFQAEDGIRDPLVTGVQTCALPISRAFVDSYTVLKLHEEIEFGLLFLGPPGVGKTHLSVAALRALILERSEERRVGKECRSRWSQDR